MKHRESKAKSENATEDDHPGRRGYQQPAIIERQRLEAMAAECSAPGGKNDPTCMFGFS